MVLDAAGFGPDPQRRAEALFAAGADWIQLRDRAGSAQALHALAAALVRARAVGDAPSRRPRRVLLNRWTDLARAVGADGAHLGFDAVDATDARRLLGPDALVGRSLHSVEEIEHAAGAEAPPDYVHLAPIWNPNSKPASRPALGTAALSAAAAHGLPVIAQGGLDPARAQAAVQAGAAGIAVTGDLARGASPATLAPLRKYLDEFR